MAGIYGWGRAAIILDITQNTTNRANTHTDNLIALPN